MAANPSDAGDDSSKKKSVVIVDMPVDLINRDILKRHFEQFGTVERLACSVSKRYAVIHFSTAEEAENAAKNGATMKPDAPPLKIYNRAINEYGSKSKPAPPPAPPEPPRLVTRRKIVRTFNTGSIPSTSTSLIRESSFSSSSSENIRSNPESTEPHASSSTYRAPQQGPLRASVKISRPSPFLKKKPSFGEKSGKPASGGSKNPFALPPRSMLSLDRRKIVKVAKSNNKADSQNLMSSDTSTLHTNVQDSNIQRLLPALEQPCSSSEILLPDEDSYGEQPKSSPSVSEERAQMISDLADYQQEQDSNPPTEGHPTSTLDVDETTEDAILNDDDDDDEDNVGNQDLTAIDEENIIAEGEDTQDTAEVSTEEEGEIHDEEDDEGDQNEEDEQERNEEDEGDDDVYESPLKRMEETAAAKEGTSAASSSGPFSFKLSPSKNPQSSTSGPSLFKMPFASPFASVDGPKPFSSSSFGIQLSSSDVSKVFASSSSSAGTSAAKLEKTQTFSEETKEKPKAKPFSAVSVAPKKDPLSETEKPKASPFGLFSSFSSNAAAKKPSSSSSKNPASSASSSAEGKSSLFSRPKSMSTFSLGGSTSKTIPLSKKSVASTSASALVARTRTPPPPYQGSKDTPNPLLLSFTPDTPEALELFGKRSITSEEKYRILEARDKLIRSRIPKNKVSVEHATKLIGTCPDMCPEKERYMRQFQRQLVPYETLPGQDHIVDHQKAIKVYSRSSADQEEPLPHELRPGPTLDYTMHYLLHYIVPLGDNPDENLSDWYNFLWDRTRSIRKDITQQQIIDLTAVSLYEKCARFHIHCASRLCELDVHSFDPKLNDENLMKCLQSLEHLYEDLRRRQVTCPSEPEFRAYQIMMNLNEGDELYKAQQLPSWILNSQQVQTALKLHHSIYTKNFYDFFKTVESLPYMTSCILHRYFFQVRSLALRCFVKAHCTLPKYETAMPISTLQNMLGYGSAVLSFSYLCEAHGIHCDVEENKVILKRKLFYLPDFPSIYREEHLIDSKLQTTVAEAVNGGPLPNIDFANRQPHSSFDENGQLIPGDIIGSGSQSQDSKSTTTFIPPEPNVASRSFYKPTVAPGSFSFGGIFSQPKKEVPPVQPPKPFRQIESVCQDATSKLIDESIKQDLAQLSQARLEEAKKMREEAAKKKLREEIATKLATEYVDKAITQQVDALIRMQGSSRIRQFKQIDEVTQIAAATLIDESVIINLSFSARTELILAKEYHHRLLRTLEQIFQRIRARFAVLRWIKFRKTKVQEREREEEKRREELWNFPPGNSSMSTKDMYRAFCGTSKAQPSLNKVDYLSSSPESILLNPTRPKRKSGGEENIASKVPRLEKELDVSQPSNASQMWDFPPSNPYSRTNRQVLEALCGRSMMGNFSVTPNIPVGEKRKSDFNEILFSLANNSPFKIHRPAEKLDVGRGLGKEIRHKANESNTDLLKNIQSFLSQIKDEKEKSKPLEPYFEGVEAINKACPELDVSLESVKNDQDEEDSDCDGQFYSETNTNHMTHGDNGIYSILSGAFIEEDKLLNQIRQFTRQIKEEKANWKTDTFLNDIDVNIEL